MKYLKLIMILLVLSSCNSLDILDETNQIEKIKENFASHNNNNLKLDIEWEDQVEKYSVNNELIYEFQIKKGVRIESIHQNTSRSDQSNSSITLVVINSSGELKYALRHLSIDSTDNYSVPYYDNLENFSGIETYYDLSLNFIQSRIINKGKTLDWGSSSSKKSNTATRTNGCITVGHDIYVTVCIDGTNDCDTHYSHTEHITYCDGFQDDDGGFGGGDPVDGSAGGGGGSGGPGSSSGDGSGINNNNDLDLLYPIIDWQNSTNSKRASHIVNYLRFCRNNNQPVNIEAIFNNFPEYGVMDAYEVSINVNGESVPIYIEIPISHGLTTFQNIYGESKATPNGDRWIFRYFKDCGGCSYPLMAFEFQVPIDWRDFFVDYLLGL